MKEILEDDGVFVITKEMNIGDLDIHISMLIGRPEILYIEIGKNEKIEIKHELDYFDFIVTLENGNKIPLIK